MSLTTWYQKAQRLNALAPRRCPRQPPCSLREDVAYYEYVTGKEGRAIVLRCLECGGLKHFLMGASEQALFEPLWTPGDPLPIPSRVVHLPEGPKRRKPPWPSYPRVTPARKETDDE